MKIDYQLASGGTYAIETLHFDEENTNVSFSTLSVEQRGTTGNDWLYGIDYGVSNNDILDGREGDDSLAGGAGNDTYMFSAGTDLISESAGTDTILFRDGWSPEDVNIFLQAAYGSGVDDLVIQDANGNRIIGESHYDSPGARIEYVEFSDATVWTLSSMNLPVWGTAGNDSLSLGGSSGATYYGFAGNDSIWTYDSGDDVIDGGDGNDSLNGAGGNDTYIYNAGLDTIVEGGGTDTVLITGGVTISDITTSVVSTFDLKIVVNAGTDELLLNDIFYPHPNYPIETLAFDDGFWVDPMTHSTWLKGTSGSDAISGNGNANMMIGYDGDDIINAGAANDNAHGGAGADIIHGDGGNDLLYGGKGNDLLYGGDGLDTLVGGGGADSFVFESASGFNNVDQVEDFSVSETDVLDFTDILSAVYDPLTDAITDFIQITDNGADSTVAVDVNGGADNFVAVATLLGATGLTDEQALETSGRLLAA